MAEKETCRLCGAEILAQTAERNDGLCAVCPPGQISGRHSTIEPGTTLDRSFVNIRRESHSAEHTDYIFECALLDRDPRNHSRYLVVGNVFGLLRLMTADGSVSLLHGMSGDTDNEMYELAKRRVFQCWKTGQFQDEMIGRPQTTP